MLKKNNSKCNMIKLECQIELNTNYYIITNKSKKYRTIEYKIENGLKKKKNVYLDINNHIIDKEWLENVIEAYQEKNLDKIKEQNNFFMLYYSLIYLRENSAEYDIVFEKLKYIYSTENLTNYLSTFLNNNKYKIKYNYKCTNYLNRDNLKKISNEKKVLIEYYFRRLIVYIYRFFIKKYKKIRIVFNKIKNTKRPDFLKKYENFKECSKLNVSNSASSCLFYKAVNNTDDKLFIKDCEIKCLDSIKREKQASKYLRSVVKNENNYLFDLAKESNSYLIMPFVSSPTLDDYIKNNRIDKTFIILLIEFGENILDELYLTKIIHRDIRPENIIVIPYNSSISFKLIDFGCSLQLENLNLMKNKVFKYDFYTAGIHYKAGVNLWDDAGSFYLMCKNIAKENNCYDEDILKTIKKRIGRIYYL